MAAAIAGAAGASLGSTASSAPDDNARRLTLLHLTDTHATLETHPEYLPGRSPEFQMMGGYARLKTCIDRERAVARDPLFLLDGGDEFQGSGPAAWSEGEVIVEPLNALGIDAFVPGNWEPAYGPPRFKELMGKLKAPVVCYNFHDKASGDRLFKPALMLQRGDVRIAVIGITDIKASERQPPVEYEGMDTTRTAGLREFVQQLRANEKPDLVVAVMHTGLTISRQFARDIPEFDVILSGHTHERTERPILEGNVIIVEPGCFGSFLGRLDLTLKPGGGVAAHAWRMIPVREAEYPEDPAVKGLVDTALKPFRERMQTVLAQSRTPLLRYDVLETSADNLITDAVRDVAKADIGFSNGFRFGVPVVAGAVTETDIWSMLPMDTRMKAGWITGSELRDYLEKELELVFSKEPMKLSGGWGPRASGMTMVYHAKGEPGKRLVSVKVNGKEVEPDQRFTIAGCEREGEPVDVICRHKGTHDAKVLPTMLHAAIGEYLRARRVIAPTREKRAAAVDLAPVVFSQDAVLSNNAQGAGTPATVPAFKK